MPQKKEKKGGLQIDLALAAEHLDEVVAAAKQRPPQRALEILLLGFVQPGNFLDVHVPHQVSDLPKRLAGTVGPVEHHRQVPGGRKE